MAPGDSEATYREIFEINPLPMWVCHRESRRFLAVNGAALLLYGYRRGEFLELSLPMLDAGAPAPEPAPERRLESQVAEGVSVQADPRLARQLLEILIGNAWKFSAPARESRIEFGTGEKNGETFYFVRDNGVGFDMAYADKLFSAFHRLHRADEFGGSGVGLAIAQRIVARHGGRIWAESAPGQGATFFFTLPGNP